MPGFVYIIQDERGMYYIGSTDNPTRRIAQHQHGHTWSTQRFKNPHLVFTQEYPTLFEARKIEAKLKKLKRKDYLSKIIADGYIKTKP